MTIRARALAATLCALAWTSAGSTPSYSDGFESQLLDDLVERGKAEVETAPAPRGNQPSPTAGPLASAAQDMRRAAEAMRGVDASDWDEVFAAQDAALAKLRRLLEGVDAATGRLELASTAQESQQSAAQAASADDQSATPEESEPNQANLPSGSDGPPSDGAPHEGQQTGGSERQDREEEGAAGRYPGQTGGTDAAAGGGTAAAAARDEAAAVQLREAIDRLQKMQWGLLPPRLREQLSGGGAAEFAEGYEQPTAAYFEELGRRLQDQTP